MCLLTSWKLNGEIQGLPENDQNPTNAGWNAVQDLPLVNIPGYN